MDDCGTTSAGRAASGAPLPADANSDEPITIGFEIGDNGIVASRVLAFRESRGWEIRFEAFTAQFEGASLEPSRELDRSIDNITGATLSVNAYKRLARFALWLHQHVQTST